MISQAQQKIGKLIPLVAICPSVYLSCGNVPNPYEAGPIPGPMEGWWEDNNNNNLKKWSTHWLNRHSGQRRKEVILSVEFFLLFFFFVSLGFSLFPTGNRRPYFGGESHQNLWFFWLLGLHVWRLYTHRGLVKAAVKGVGTTGKLLLKALWIEDSPATFKM